MQAFRRTRTPKVLKPDVPADQQWINSQTGKKWEKYVEKMKEKHGPECDPFTAPYDPQVAMVAGEGRRNGRFAFANGAFDTTGTPTLSQIRARSVSSSPSIERRPRPGLDAIAAMQVQSFFSTRISCFRCAIVDIKHPVG